MATLIDEELNSCRNALKDNQEELTKLIETKKDLVPEDFIAESRQLVEKANSLTAIPGSYNNDIVLHFIGSSSSFKTSLVLDLFNYEPLNKLLGSGKTGEHTAVPCIIEPVKEIKSDTYDFYKIDIDGNETSIKNEDEFSILYEINDNDNTVYNYFLKVNIPSDKASFKKTIIEYPGIETPDEKVKKSVIERQATSKENMLRCIQSYPGIIIACYATKVRLPAGDPISDIFDKNRELLNKFKAGNYGFKLPLILSLNGQTLVQSYINCNDDITETIKTYFGTISEDYDIEVAFVNPKNNEHGFDANKNLSIEEHNDYSWVNTSSIYSNIDEAIQSISKDGGISFIRGYYSKLIDKSAIPELITNFYKQTSLNTIKDFLTRIKKHIKNLNKYDTCLIIQENIRKASLSEEGYKTIAELYDSKNSHNININTWSEIISDYIKQFLGDTGLTSNDEGITDWLRIYITAMCNDQSYDENICTIRNDDTLSFNFIDDFDLLFKNIISIQIANMIKRCDSELQHLLKKEGN